MARNRGGTRKPVVLNRALQMLSWSLRDASTPDAVAIACVHVAAWRETYGGSLPDSILADLDVDARAKMWASALLDPANLMSVLDHNGEIVGFGACGPQRDPTLRAAGYEAEIGAIYILRVAQGLGAGRTLMRHMAIGLAARGMKGLSLWVLEANERARRFYEHLGGEMCGERQGSPPEGRLKEVAYGWANLRLLTGG